MSLQEVLLGGALQFLFLGYLWTLAARTGKWSVLKTAQTAIMTYAVAAAFIAGTYVTAVGLAGADEGLIAHRGIFPAIGAWLYLGTMLGVWISVRQSPSRSKQMT